MPYISKDKRVFYDTLLSGLGVGGFKKKGDFAYFLYAAAKYYLNNRLKDYTNIHDCIYTYESVADELKRRLLHPYEDERREENGDIPL